MHWCGVSTHKDWLSLKYTVDVMRYYRAETR